MGRRRRLGPASALLAVTIGVVAAGCGDSATGGNPAPRDPTAGIYDEFLQARTLAASLTAPQPGVETVARERKIVEDRQVLRNLEAGIDSKRALLADARRDLPADQPNESLYFRIWSSHLGDGDRPAFVREAGGGLTYRGRRITRDAALQCAVPARLTGDTFTPFLDCLTNVQGGAPAPQKETAR